MGECSRPTPVFTVRRAVVERDGRATRCERPPCPPPRARVSGSPAAVSAGTPCLSPHRPATDRRATMGRTWPRPARGGSPALQPAVPSNRRAAQVPQPPQRVSAAPARHVLNGARAAAAKACSATGGNPCWPPQVSTDRPPRERPTFDGGTTRSGGSAGQPQRERFHPGPLVRRARPGMSHARRPRDTTSGAPSLRVSACHTPYTRTRPSRNLRCVAERSALRMDAGVRRAMPPAPPSTRLHSRRLRSFSRGEGGCSLLVRPAMTGRGRTRLPRLTQARAPADPVSTPRSRTLPGPREIPRQGGQPTSLTSCGELQR